MSFSNNQGVAADYRTKMFSNLSRAASPRTSRRPPGRRFRVEHTQSGAQELRSLQELFLTSRERFLGIAYGILRSREDAEDAVQDAFLSACRHLREFEGRSALTTWFTRVVMNAALMVRRKRKNAAPLEAQETEATMSTFVETIADVRPNPEQAYSQAESSEILQTRLKKLNPRLREAVSMTYYDELSDAEASAALGIPLSTYKSRLFRGRRLLQAKVQSAQQTGLRLNQDKRRFPPQSESPQADTVS
jgi:RNA polymerase sigma-70 factor (ECF subfamily)